MLALEQASVQEPARELGPVWEPVLEQESVLVPPESEQAQERGWRQAWYSRRLHYYQP